MCSKREGGAKGRGQLVPKRAPKAIEHPDEFSKVWATPHQAPKLDVVNRLRVDWLLGIDSYQPKS